jgi:hypothetical protein
MWRVTHPGVLLQAAAAQDLVCSGVYSVELLSDESLLFSSLARCLASDSLLPSFDALGLCF